MPSLDRLVLSHLPRHARIVELCCGTGHVAAALARRGFLVTGLDGSEDMLRFARENAPRGRLCGSRRAPLLIPRISMRLSPTFDSVNHLLSVEDVRAALRNVHGALVPGGIFVFDLNMAAAFRREWSRSSTIAESDHVCYVRGRYDRENRLGVAEVTTFRLNGHWTRRDLTIYQRCYVRSEVRQALIGSGFSAVATHTAKSLGSGAGSPLAASISPP